MAKSRKDSKGHVLRKGEYERGDGRYMYQYTDISHKRQTEYAKDLVELREKEREIQRMQEDGIDCIRNKTFTLNDAFDKYIACKYDLKQSTRTNYNYMYDKYVRETFGNRRLCRIKYSDIKQFYYSLIIEKKFKPNSLEVVNNIIHPTLTMAVRDGILRINPSDGVMNEIKKSNSWKVEKRHALTKEQQLAFMQYIDKSPIYQHWLPLFITLLGTGGRISEIIGLCWHNVDWENRMIQIDHNLVYRIQDSGRCEFHITSTKTRAGTRVVPMLNIVYNALRQEYEIQKKEGFSKVTVDGYTDFVFVNRFGNVHNPTTINRTIKRIYEAYNREEEEKAKKENRTPLLIPHFSCHHLRHTFCARLCEEEPNMKVIQSIMGHADISTTMDVYAELTEDRKRKSFQKLDNKIRIL